jgi:hypothetical protein
MFEKDFKFVIPAELAKGADGEWVVQGLASTSSKDRQGEVILPEGIDASPIDEGRGLLNWDHLKGPENILGSLDSYKKTPEGFFVKGRLFKNHDKAKSVHQIMSSLNKSDKLKMGMSVEGKILERAGQDGKIIKKCQINAVALTMNPVNQDSFVDLVKSMSGTDLEFNSSAENLQVLAKTEEKPVFTAKQVLNLLEKTLGVGAGAATEAPAARTQGDALAQEDLDKKPKDVTLADEAIKAEVKPGKLKKMSKELYKSSMMEVLNKIQELYPHCTRAQIWECMQDRLNKKYPEIKGDF